MATTVKREHIALGLAGTGLFMAPILGGKVNVGAAPVPGFFAGLLEPALSFSAFALVGLLLAGAWLVAVAGQKVMTIPHSPIIRVLGALVVCGFLPLAWASFGFLALVGWAQWLGYAVTLVAVISCAGRGRGPLVLVGCLAAGAAVVAAYGILEYGAARVTDPTWRIFSTWMNPNALAGMLVLVLPVLLAMLGLELDRLVRLAIGAGAVLVGLALLLTQSKGGFLALGIGLVGWVLVSVGARKGRSVVPGLVAVVALVGLGFAVQQANTRPAGAGALARVGSASAESEQSAGYRTLLWRGAVDLIQMQPMGSGLGSYRFESARSGRTPQTQLAHQGFLQFGVEAGVAGLIALVAFAGIWFWAVFRGFRSLPANRQVLLAGIVGAVLAGGTRNMIDSDLFHAGFGVTLFALMGIGLLLSADGASPEVLSVPARRFLALFPPALFLVVAIYGLRVESGKALALASPPEAAQNALAGLAGIAPTDGEIPGLHAQFATDPMAATELLKRAAQLSPSPRNWRRLAQVQIAANQTESARQSLAQALLRDPNNLPARLMLVEIGIQEQNQEAAREALTQLIAIEKLPYFQVNPLPDLIPTEIAEGRAQYALAFPTVPDRDTLLMVACEQFDRYRAVTVARLAPVVREGFDSPFPGETGEEARRKLELGAAAAAVLAESPEPRFAAAGRAFASGFADALGNF